MQYTGKYNSKKEGVLVVNAKTPSFVISVKTIEQQNNFRKYP
jgi:hypothetical protein